MSVSQQRPHRPHQPSRLLVPATRFRRVAVAAIRQHPGANSTDLQSRQSPPHQVRSMKHCHSPGQLPCGAQGAQAVHVLPCLDALGGCRDHKHRLPPARPVTLGSSRVVSPRTPLQLSANGKQGVRGKRSLGPRISTREARRYERSHLVTPQSMVIFAKQAPEMCVQHGRTARQAAGSLEQGRAI